MNAADEQLAQLLDDCTHRARAGLPVDLETIAAEHPLLAREFRQLWAVAQLAQFSRDIPVRVVDTSISPTPSVQSLPREFGDYTLLRELGRGGMGVVYQAHQKSLNRVVALKMVREAHLASDDDRARFRAEAAAAARLSHPNIVTVHETGLIDGQAFFCMAYVEGETLAQQLARLGSLAPRDAAKLVAEIARGVHHAHEQGVLHRDLKPGNILLEEMPGDGLPPSGTSAIEAAMHVRPKIADFGLAKRLDTAESLTRTGMIVGTPSYMAPEQAAARKDITPASDVYSLGAILYELLTGRPPFPATQSHAIIQLILEQEPVPPRQLNGLIDRDLEMICLKCLQKPPLLRYASANALAEDLTAYVVGEAVSTRPSGLGYVLARILRETHHAPVLENWGVLWMWHSLMIFLLCLFTQVMDWLGIKSHAYYLALWTGGLLTWGTILWTLRGRAGPVLFVERQIAHAWAAGVLASIVMFIIEVLAKQHVLSLSPAIAVAAGMVFVFKAGILSGQFYLYAALNFIVAGVMPLVPAYGVLLFGAVSAVCFFFPGLKYYRQRQRTQQ